MRTLGGMIFLRFKRVKTASQQGISLFKDPNDSFTCPLHTLAVALFLQSSPGSRIFPQFSAALASSSQAVPNEDDKLGLIALLDRELDETSTSEVQQQRKTNTAPGAQA